VIAFFAADIGVEPFIVLFLNLPNLLVGRPFDFAFDLNCTTLNVLVIMV
jgi:hypothetical protein